MEVQKDFAGAKSKTGSGRRDKPAATTPDNFINFKVFASIAGKRPC